MLSRAKLPLAAIFAIWTLWGVWSAQQSSLASFVTGQAAAGRANPWQVSLAAAWVGALLTTCVMAATRVIRDRIPTHTARALTHIACFLGVHLADVTMYWLASDVIGSNPRPFVPMLFSLVTFNAMAYAVAAFIITALDSQQALRARETRESQLETQLALAQFHTLRAQLQPHFLFNALNAISTLIHSDPTRADRMLARISDLLRISADTASTPEVSLDAEVDFAKRYLEIERMRYGDRLGVDIAVSGDTRHALVPNMILQPLVENAVRHGVAPHARAGHVAIDARADGGALSIVVRDSGGGFDGDRGDGVGLSATRERLRRMYGDHATLSFAHIADGFEARVRLPLRAEAV